MLVFGWKDLYCAWSRDRLDHPPQTLTNYLIDNIILEQDKQIILDKPMIDLPSCGENRPTLGQKAADIELLDKLQKKEEEIFFKEAIDMRVQLELDGVIDRNKRIHPTPMPSINATFVDTNIEQLWEYTEENGEVRVQWCQGLVVAVKEKKSSNNKVEIKWNETYVREGGRYPAVTEETLLETYWNKHRIKG